MKLSKKFAFAAIMALATSMAFAEVKAEIHSCLSAFLSGGSFMLVRSKSRSIYYPARSISHFACDADTLKYYWLDTGNDYEEAKLSLKNASVKIDEKKNLIIDTN